jgi:hypothetical protein
VNSGSRKNNSFRCKGGGKRLSNFGLVALATLGCFIADHGMLAMTLAAIFRQHDSATASLETSKARPSQEREEDQDRYTHYPEVMFLAPFHDASRLLLSNPRGSVNLPFSFSETSH